MERARALMTGGDKAQGSKEIENPDEFKTRVGKLEAEIAVIKQLLRMKRKKLKQYKSTVFEEAPCPCDTPASKEKLVPRLESGTDGGQSRGSLKRKKGQVSLRPRGSARRNKKKKAKKETCGSAGVNCFYHTEHHWKVPPLWNRGEFCFCPNAGNNSYFCLRTLNATHNFLYCEFITGFVEYFDMIVDPYQLTNIAHTLNTSIRQELHELLVRLKVCKGSRECTHYYGKAYPVARPTQPTTSNTSNNATSKGTTEKTSASTLQTTGNMNATISAMTSAKPESSSVSPETVSEEISAVPVSVSESSTIVSEATSPIDGNSSPAFEKSSAGSTVDVTTPDVSTASFEVLSSVGSSPSQATEITSSSLEESSVPSEAPGTFPEHSTVISDIPPPIDSISTPASDITTPQVEQSPSASDVSRISSENTRNASDLPGSTHDIPPSSSVETTPHILEKSSAASKTSPATSLFASSGLPTRPVDEELTTVAERAETSTKDPFTRFSETTAAAEATEVITHRHTGPGPNNKTEKTTTTRPVTTHKENSPRTTTRPPANKRPSRKRQRSSSRSSRKKGKKEKHLVSTNVLTKVNTTTVHKVLPVTRAKEGKRKKNSKRGKGKKSKPDKREKVEPSTKSLGEED